MSDFEQNAYKDTNQSKMTDKIKENIKEKNPKERIRSIIYGRTAIILLLVLVQLGAFVVLNVYMNVYRDYIMYVTILIKLLAIIFVVNDRTEPSFRITWLVIIAIFPIFGVALYLFVRSQSGAKRLNRNLEGTITETKHLLVQDKTVFDHLCEVSPMTSRFATYMSNYAGYPIYENTSAQYFPLGDDAFVEMKKQMLRAEKFIFLEFFIISPGEMWDEIKEILAQKVKKGVEVRLLYDGTCHFAKLPYEFPAEMEQLGITCRVFSPIRPVLSSRQNNRDHRKILIVDGKVAFTGGINLADEYINKIVRFGHWKDNAVMISGDAVMSFTLMFLQMWDTIDNRLDQFDRYIFKSADPESETEHGEEADSESDCAIDPDADEFEGFVLPYSDSPLDQERVGEEVYLNMIHSATKYVHIMTPYLIPGHELIDTLQHAGKKGIEVKIIMPGIPDKWFANFLAKTYYRELIEAGVEIYEYTPGFVHAKTMIVDDKRTAIGTINLDFRSLYLHFECGVFFYRNKVVQDAENDFLQTLKSCKKITLQDAREIIWYKKIIGKLLRLVAPLM